MPTRHLSRLAQLCRRRSRQRRWKFWHEGRCVTTHERCYGRYQEKFELEHYLDVSEHKPGALVGSKPLAQLRQLGRWPASYDRFWQGLIDRYGRQKGTKELIELLQLGRTYGQEKLRVAIEGALTLGCGDSATVRYLLNAHQLERASVEPVAVGELAIYERPLPMVTDYDRLLVGGEAR